MLVVSECFVTTKNAHNGETMACHHDVILAQPAGVVLSGSEVFLCFTVVGREGKNRKLKWLYKSTL